MAPRMVKARAVWTAVREQAEQIWGQDTASYLETVNFDALERSLNREPNVSQDEWETVERLLRVRIPLTVRRVRADITYEHVERIVEAARKAYFNAGSELVAVPTQEAEPQPVKAREAESPSVSEEQSFAEQAEPRRLDIPEQQLGRETVAYTAKNTRVAMRFAVVSLEDLLASHNPVTWHENDAFPDVLQPRDRSAAAMREQVRNIANQLHPERLGESPSTSTGAPIVGEDGIVESGNGRWLALWLAYHYNQTKADEYRQWLVENAERFGISPLVVQQMRYPILVRIRPVEEDLNVRSALVQEMGLSDVASFSSVERALMDANAIEGLINLFKADYPLTSPENDRFVEAFIQRLPVGERNELLLPGGELSLEERIYNALLAYGYPNYELLQKILESKDLEIQRVAKAIASSAPEMARLKAVLDMARRQRKTAEADAYDISKDIANAALRLEDIRRAGHRVSEYLLQGELFSSLAIPPIEKLLLAAFDTLTSQKQLRLFLGTYADMARRALELAIMPDSSLSAQMLDAKKNLPNKERILAHALSVARGGGTASLFEEEQSLPEIPTAEEILAEAEAARQRAKEERAAARQAKAAQEPASQEEQAGALPASRIADAVFSAGFTTPAELVHALKNGDWRKDNIFKWARQNIEGWQGTEEEIDWLFDAIEAYIAAHLGNRASSMYEQIERTLPRRARTTRISELQQFSTPFSIAWWAQELASLSPNDRVYEPMAGTAHLVSRMPDMLSRHGKILLNELDGRRHDLLRRVVEIWRAKHPNLEIELHNGDALRLQMEGKPSLIIMNPPWGKYSRGTYGTALPGMVDIAERFTNWELEQHLSTGGRLVAVMPTTILEGQWLKNIHQKYAIRAVVRLPGWMYRARGTGVESVLLVVDKVEPEPFATWSVIDLSKYTEEQALEMNKKLVRLRDSLPPREEVNLDAPKPVFRVSAEVGGRPAGEPVGEEARQSGAGDTAGSETEVSAGSAAPTDVLGDISVATGGDRGAGAAGESVGGGDVGVGEGAVATRPEPAVATGGESELRPEPEGVSGGVAEGVGGGGDTAGVSGGEVHGGHGTSASPAPAGTDASGEVAERVAEERRREAEQSASALGYNPDLYARYVPFDARTVSEHPRLVVEPASLASMPRPKITIPVPDVLRQMRESGIISDPQFDAVMLTLQAFEENHGVVIADDVGLGKTREIGAALFTLFATGKIKNALVTTYNETNIIQLQEEFNTLFRRFYPPVRFVYVGDTKIPRGADKHNLPLPRGENIVYFAHSYNLSDYAHTLARIPLDVWFADESHTVRGSEGSWKRSAWRGMHGSFFVRGSQRIFYFSATPAQDAEELREYYSLGYWTLDDRSWDAFVGVVTGTSQSTQRWEELLAEIYASGSQALKEMESHKQDDFRQRDSGRSDVRMRYCDIEQVVRELYSAGRYLSRDLSRYGVSFEVMDLGLTPAQQQALEQTISLFRDIYQTAHRYVGMGDKNASLRFGLITGQLQFAMKRIYQALRLQRVMPYIKQALAEGKQVVLYTEAVSETQGEGGNIASAIESINTSEFRKNAGTGGMEYVGEIPEAVEAIARLKERARDIYVPSAREVLLQHFSEDEIAFVLGKGTTATRRNAHIQDFQRGKRRIALLSRVGSTGISLHDVNGAQRVLIMLDTPWRADEYRQVLGRVDRTGQKSSPHVVFAMIGEPGERKIVSTIASRLRSLGALAKGEASGVAGSSALGEFEIEPSLAATILRDLWRTRWRDDGTVGAFTHRRFISADRDGNLVPVPVLDRQTEFKHFMLDLMCYMPPDRARRVYEDFLSEYTRWVRENEALSMKVRGHVISEIELLPGTRAYVVEAEGWGHRFGVVGGKILLPQAGSVPVIVEASRAEGGKQRLRYVLGRDSETGAILSGVQLSLGALSALMALYEQGGEFTAEKAWNLLTVDKSVYTFSPRTEKPYRLVRTRVRETGEVRIRIDHARMEDKQVLFNAGAAYDARLAYWFIPFNEQAFKRFVNAFPLIPPSRIAEAGSGGVAEGQSEEDERRERARGVFYRTEGGVRIPMPEAPPLEGDGRVLDDTQAIIFRLGRFLRIARIKKKGVTGWYDPGTGDVAIRRWGDIPSAVHEIAHAVDDEYGVLAEWAKPRVRSPFDEELMPFAPERDYANLREQRAEAFASYMEALVINPEFAKSAAPEFYAYLREKLPEEFWQEWERFTEEIQQWLFGDAGAKIRAHFAFDRPSVKDAPAGTFRIHWVDQLAKWFFDDRWAAIKAWREAKRRTGKEPLPHEDFELLISLWAGRYGTYQDIVRRGVPRNMEGTERSASFVDLLEQMDTSSWKAFKQDALDLFAFMGAQRTLELWSRKRAEALNALRKRLKIELPEGADPALDDDIRQALREAEAEGDEKTVRQIERVYEYLEAQRTKIAGWGGGLIPDDTIAYEYLTTLREHEPERYARLEAMANTYRDIADAVLDYAVASGRLTQKEVDAIRESNRFYEDWHRVFGMDAPRVQVTTSGNIARARAITWKMRGSTRQIHNPIVSLMEAVARAVSECNRNYALLQFTRVLKMERDMYEGEPVLLADIGRRVDAPTANSVKIYTPDGEEYWEFHPEVQRAFDAWMDMYASEGWNLFAQIWGGLARVAYHGVVLHPKFLLWNLMRDTGERLIRGKYGAGLPRLSNRQDWMFFGGSQAGFLHRDREDYYKEFEALAEEVIRKPRHWVLAPVWGGKRLWKWYRRVAETSEELGRLDLFHRAYRYAKGTLGYDDFEAKLFAAFASRQHLDFRVAGSLVRVLNRLIPFTSATVRAMAMALDALVPAGGGGKGGGKGGTPKGAGDMPWHYRRWGVGGTVSTRHFAFATWVKLFLFGVLVTALVRWWNRQDEDAWEEYQEFPPYQRYMFWLIRTPYGWLNIPKPYEYGVLASGIEAAMEGESLEWARTLARVAAPADEGDLALGLSGVVGAVANYDFFRGRYIVPPFEADRALFDDRGKVARKGVERASPLAREVGLRLGIDPRKVDYLLRQQGGHWGGTASELSRLLAGEKTGKQFVAQQLGLTRELTPYASETVQDVLARAKETGRLNTKVVQSLRQEIDRWYAMREQGRSREELRRQFERILTQARRAKRLLDRPYRARNVEE